MCGSCTARNSHLGHGRPGVSHAVFPRRRGSTSGWPRSRRWPRRWSLWAATAPASSSASAAASSPTWPVSWRRSSCAASRSSPSPPRCWPRWTPAWAARPALICQSGKNLIGAFHQPLAVLTDPSLLATLPEREYRAGLFEVLKCGVIRSQPLFRLLADDPAPVLRRDPAVVERMIAESVRIKCEVVSSRRERTRFASHPQLRPHGRPRHRGRDRLHAATCTARRSGWA